MRSHALRFSSIVKTIYELPIEEKLEIKNLLENNIADARRSEIANNYKKTQEKYKSGKQKFSSSMSDLKKML